MAEFTPYMSEIRFFGGASTDFVEVALDNGADPSTVTVVVYNNNGTVRSTNSLDATPDDTIAGTDVYTVESAVHKNGAVALTVDGVVVAFVSFHQTVTATEGAADGMTSTPLGTNANGESFVSTDMGASYSVNTSPDPGTIPCFLRGTMIDTPNGRRPIETLRKGDLVHTEGEGNQPLSWVGSRRLNRIETRRSHLYPVRIPAGVFGLNAPAHDLLVSPAHRVLVANPVLELLFAVSEVLVPASHLVGWNGIRIAHDVTRPEYFHLLFESHQLVRSNGLLTESFHPQQIGLAALEGEARAELFELFPGLKYRPSSYGPTARRCLRQHETFLAISCLPAAA